VTPALFDRLDEVRGRLARAPSVLIGLDFDGTLTPIVDRPEDASLGPAARQVLERLVRRPRVAVAVISGRRWTDVVGRVGVPGVIVAGNHGMDIRGPGLHYVEPTAWTQRPALAVLAAALRRALRDLPGAVVEDKGLTIAVHYRHVAREQVADVQAAVDRVVSGHSGQFRRTGGHSVLEIRPRVEWHKGRALRWIREHCGLPAPLVFFAGDDETDEDAFRDLTDGVTVRVGDVAGTAAAYVVDGPASVVRFLDYLATTPLAEARPT